MMEKGEREEVCKRVEGGKVVVTGITRSFLKRDGNDVSSAEGNLTLVMDKGKVACFGSSAACITHSLDATPITLQNGHILPGLIGASQSLGMADIITQTETADGNINHKLDPLDPENLVYAKYGVHLDGKLFARARIGGVTKSVTLPLGGEYGGFVGGVSVGIRTDEKHSLLDGGIFKDEVALHFEVGQGAKGAYMFLIFPLLVRKRLRD